MPRVLQYNSMLCYLNSTQPNLDIVRPFFGFPILGIRYESDDVIWLRNHASTWILVPNIGCKQTMASNTGGPLTFFGVHTFFF